MKINNIVNMKDYGEISVTVGNLMNKMDKSAYYISKITGLKHETVKNYKDNVVSRVDLDVLAKLCYALGCEVKDIIKYNPPKNK